MPGLPGYPNMLTLQPSRGAAPQVIINPNTGLPMPSIGLPSPGYVPSYSPTIAEAAAALGPKSYPGGHGPILNAPSDGNASARMPGEHSGYRIGELGGTGTLEGAIPLNTNVSRTVSTYSGPSIADLQAQLGAQIAGLQGAGNRAGKQVGGLYAQLAAALGQDIPAEDRMYGNTIRQSGNLYGGLDRGLRTNYGAQLGALAAEMARTGQSNRFAGEKNQIVGDENFIRGLGATLGTGALSSLQLLKQGAHDYNTAVTGMARTEGANRRADIAQAILDQIANARVANASSISKARAAMKSSTKTISPTSVAGLLQAMGGKWSKKGLAALNTYLGSKQAQQGGMYDITHQVIDPKTGKPVDAGQFIKENPSTMSRYLYGQLSQGLNNTENQARAQQLATLMSQMYYGKKNYAG